MLHSGEVASASAAASRDMPTQADPAAATANIAAKRRGATPPPNTQASQTTKNKGHIAAVTATADASSTATAAHQTRYSQRATASTAAGAHRTAATDHRRRCQQRQKRLPLQRPGDLRPRPGKPQRHHRCLHDHQKTDRRESALPFRPQEVEQRQRRVADSAHHSSRVGGAGAGIGGGCPHPRQTPLADSTRRTVTVVVLMRDRSSTRRAGFPQRPTTRVSRTQRHKTHQRRSAGRL